MLRARDEKTRLPAGADPAVRRFPNGAHRCWYSAPRGQHGPLLYLSGAGAGAGAGDWVSAGDGLDDGHRFYVEVPPASPALVVELFDADVLMGAGAPGEVDRVRGSIGDTRVRYELYDPAGRRAATRFVTAGDDGPAAADRAWLTFFSSPAPQAGHWKLVIDMSSRLNREAGDDVNALGLRAHDGDPGHGGVELSIYSQSFLPIGIHGRPGSRQDYALFAYVTGGCALAVLDFDFDASSVTTAGALQLVSRSGAHIFGGARSGYTAFSADRAWNRSLVSGWAGPGAASEYGVWSLAVEIADPGIGNFATLRLESAADGAAVSAWTAPAGNALRIYLPSDRGSPPIKPFLSQSLAFVDGTANPPGPGGAGTYAVTLRLANPAGSAGVIDFEGEHVVTASVAAGVSYLGPVSLSAGSLLSEPERGAGGQVRWLPGSLDPGVDATLVYLVEVTRRAAGVPKATIDVTGRPGAGGTRAELLDETGTPIVLGELCQLSVPPDAALPALEVIPTEIKALLSIRAGGAPMK